MTQKLNFESLEHNKYSATSLKRATYTYDVFKVLPCNTFQVVDTPKYYQILSIPLIVFDTKVKSV